ncbi:hypothetical protein BHU72_03165 [Desulfuribacillus stibiiarsenatis]|uniref:Flagellar hook-length control protein-like C-terminal domain-containing protein n=1 Tax=Desulfuribacillus stibiiarsenatis TaxID=1390249 RepID=A0A1E5L6N0_9FIRM|nr:hypothetical protein [Desulfuribacillus stibiiarsenatis]OEH85795.1 hypothetical protein BHU72_03165 [Desulfuribacillus stibiiarsenatis]
MNVFQVFQSLTPSHFQKEQLILHNGQIVNATLMDMFANGDAKISIHGHLIRAKLESPLVKGEHIFMQVQSFQDGVVHMKLLNDPKQATQLPGNNVNELLKSTQLPQNSEWRNIVQEMMNRQLPLLPEILNNGVEILGKKPTVPQQQAWFTMLERGLPISKETFQSIHQLLNGPKVDGLVSDMLSKLQQMQTQFNNQSQTQSQTQLQQAPISQSTQQAPNTTHAQSAAQGTLLVQTSQQLQQLLSLTNIENITKVTQPETHVNQKPPNHVLLDILRLVGYQHEKEILTNRTVAPQGQTETSQQTNNQALQPINQQANVQVNQQSALPLNTKLQSNQLGITLSYTNQNIHNNQPITQTNEPVNTQTNNPASTQQPGLNLSQSVITNQNAAASIANQNQDLVQKNTIETLKSLLIQIVNQPTIPEPIRESATQLLNHITGQQLMSSPRDNLNVYQNLFVQIPISWGEQKQDTLSLQIQGRKDRRTIDPENCSIYLDLTPPNIGALGVYVHVVNKVVSVKLFTENTALEKLIDIATPSLKEGLKNIGFLLSYIKLEDTTRNPDAKPNVAKSKYNQPPKSGFDIRV